MLDTLNVAQTGLITSKTQVEGVMNNIANENTEGYKKRVVNTSELEHLDDRLTGRGVIVDDVTRITNVYMYQNLIEEQSKGSGYDQLDMMLNEIESIFYETDESGISADLQRYFESLENLRTSPQNEIYRSDLKNNADILVTNIKTLYNNIEDLETKSLSSAYEIVENINSNLGKIGDISQEILDSVGLQNDLLDKRDQLELDLAQYIDIELSRDTNYELKIGDQTAVRFNTNVHSLNLIENYVAQKDVYAQYNDTTGNIDSTLVPATWGDNLADITQEVQTVKITGEATDQVKFLGRDVPDSDLSGYPATAAEVAIDIDADKANIVATWNANNPGREIEDSPAGSGSGISVAGETITITYADTEGDVPKLDQATSNGITFNYSRESTKGAADIVTYTFNNEIDISVSYNELIENVAIGTIPETYEDITVDKDNIVRALTHKINSISTEGKITAYNGPYELDDNGNKILTNNPDHSDYDAADPNKDRYLIIESNYPGEKGKFVGQVHITNANVPDNNIPPQYDTVRSIQEKDNYYSQDAQDDIHLEIFDKEVTIKSGELNSILNNIKTDSGANKFQSYKESLDNFAKMLSDISNAYIETEPDTYVFGEKNSSLHDQFDNTVEINLFSGADVKSLTFNKSMVNTLSQEKLDYLSSIQWQNNLDFDGTGERKTSFSKFYQTLRVEIADDRENIIFKRESQDAITEAINNSYDKLTKVDKDEEMVSLIKFQAAYEANAKIITIVDEMLATILGMKR